MNDIIPNPVESPTEKKVRIANEIVREYRSQHTYYGEDIFVCGDMACDVWDRLKTEGINAEIQIGNVDKDRYFWNESNHAWVLAEIEPNRWLALEATGGYTVYSVDNPRYYSGWGFYSPKQFKDYELLLERYNDQVSKYNTQRDEYNSNVEKYNNADIIARISLSSTLDDEAHLLEQRAKDLEDTTREIKMLLETGTSSTEGKMALVKPGYYEVKSTSTYSSNNQYTPPEFPTSTKTTTKISTPTRTPVKTPIPTTLTPSNFKGVIAPLWNSDNTLFLNYMGGNKEQYLTSLEIQITPLGATKRVEYIQYPERTIYEFKNALNQRKGQVKVIAHYSGTEISEELLTDTYFDGST